MPGACILIVEDDADINRLLTTVLKRQNYDVVSAYSGSEAKMRLKVEQFDLILLDLMLPGIEGEELIASIREDQIVPIIVISAKGQQDKLNVLKIGADDFISKPFDVAEVLARVEAQLRRYMRFSGGQRQKGVLKFKNLTLDVHAVRAEARGKVISLTAHEFGILKLLMTYPSKVFTRENLFETVWGQGYFGDDNTINVHISNLRGKLDKADPHTEYIKTVWGIGFKMSDE